MLPRRLEWIAPGRCIGSRIPARDSQVVIPNRHQSIDATNSDTYATDTAVLLSGMRTMWCKN
eukprot:254156-Pyramimonas_sp.AAC.1